MSFMIWLNSQNIHLKSSQAKISKHISQNTAKCLFEREIMKCFFYTVYTTITGVICMKSLTPNRFANRNGIVYSTLTIKGDDRDIGGIQGVHWG